EGAPLAARIEVLGGVRRGRSGGPARLDVDPDRRVPVLQLHSDSSRDALPRGSRDPRLRLLVSPPDLLRTCARACARACAPVCARPAASAGDAGAERSERSIRTPVRTSGPNTRSPPVRPCDSPHRPFVRFLASPKGKSPWWRRWGDLCWTGLDASRFGSVRSRSRGRRPHGSVRWP